MVSSVEYALQAPFTPWNQIAQGVLGCFSRKGIHNNATKATKAPDLETWKSFPIMNNLLRIWS